MVVSKGKCSLLGHLSLSAKPGLFTLGLFGNYYGSEVKFRCVQSRQRGG